MQFEFKIITADTIETVVPLVKKMSKPHITEAILKERFKEMITQNYECVGVYDADQLIGVSGLWFCTRHYSGRSVELDHVFIDDAYRNKGLGTQFINWIETYVKTKGYQAIELNAYIDNVPSQNFYEKDGFQKLGYHFVKLIG
ncbi:MAG: GNAT family N-acetyltransferase [Flavobacteriaceae bacterium]|jgi:GNAT superfamily N-acetyltransferase|nr:GNAT family N-acetyltransferase [Flavobacteriaceae bacterium]MDG1042790.1 GNAT family N-acetyltransferase [Flavobacteriaceae bacterium]MDG1793497.1 GNAT family N-acetyltransferase [Flavobacteriaceae bacterium]